MALTVAILGRPNVGKSTLFNRLTGRRLALVHDRPGVTRDRREADARLGDLELRLIDTAGFEDAKGDVLEARMREQTEVAIGEADVALLLIDARAGVTPLDQHFARWLRRQSIPILIVANKYEGRAAISGLGEAHGLGQDPIGISAMEGFGLADLYAALLPYAEKADSVDGDEAGEAGDEVETPLQFAVVGRPNVGKSTLINQLVGAERLLTGPEPGVTRDAIPVAWRHAGRDVRLVDTAGLRRRAQVTDRLEKMSAGDSRRAIRYAQVVVLVLDARDMLEKQDLTIARWVVEEGRALVIAVNKWDLIDAPRTAMDRLRDRLVRSLPQVKGVPVVTLSALTGKNVNQLMPAVFSAFERWNRRVSTGALNRWLAEMIERHPPPLAGGRPIRLRYVTQPKTRPPTFAIFVSRPQELPDSYVRYLENSLRDDFDLAGVPIRIFTRKGRNPYADKK
ncbi:MAG: ribosome biogenesis GTPase Der [Alphaproteobacteria bacterium]